MLVNGIVEWCGYSGMYMTSECDVVLSSTWCLGCGWNLLGRNK